MERLFSTHCIRSSHEAAPLWTMATLDNGGLAAPVKVLVPGVWESLPELKNYHGRAVYEQCIECGGSIRFFFGGVSFRAKVWLDDALLCTHYGAYTGFEALAENVAAGVHILKVEVDNRFGDDSALHVPNDYYSYGGINRPVVIEGLRSAYITSLHIVPCMENDIWLAKITAAVRSLSDADQRFELKLTACGKETAAEKISLPARRTVTVKRTIACANVQPWAPETPALYSIAAVLLADGQPVDDLLDRFGFREVKVEGSRILLNGKPLLLKGFNRHEEFGDFGCAVPVDAMARDLELMRNIGCNCVRTCHYPNDQRFLDLCDEMGILVWEESHARSMSEKMMRHPLFLEQLHLCTREMVEQHFNHPAIFIWGCLNECDDKSEYGADCFRQTYRLLHGLDDSRPMTAALLERAGGKVYGDSDVVSINIYPQWYHNTPAQEGLHTKLTEINENGGAGKPVIVSEIGAGAVFGYHDPFGEAKWSEERQCTILREQITAVLTNPACLGVFLWQFADVRVDESWFGHRPKTFNNKGVVDEFRRPKLSYATVKELFRR